MSSPMLIHMQALSSAHAQIIEERVLAMPRHVPIHLRSTKNRTETPPASAPEPARKPWQTDHRGLPSATKCTPHAASQWQHAAQCRAARWEDTESSAANQALSILFSTAAHTNDRMHGLTQSTASKVDTLQTQLTDQGQAAREHIRQLLEDRRTREKDHHAQCELLQTQVQDLQARLAAAATESQEAMRDSIVACRQQASTEAEAAANVAQLLVERDAMEAAHAKAKQRLVQRAQEARAAASDAVTAAQHAQAALHRTKMTRDKEAARLRAANEEAARCHQEQIDKLEQRLAHALSARSELEHRRALDVQGFTNDITLLRKAVAAVDRRLHQMRLADRLQHGERLEALLMQLQSRAPEAMDAALLRDVRNIAARRETFDGAEEILAEVNSTLESMQNRVERVEENRRSQLQNPGSAANAEE